jgi:transcriptional regulator with XRE-family HTH domain
MKDRDAQTPPTFGGFLNYEMRRRGMSQREFADFCSVSHGFIARHMNHGIKPTYGGAPVGDPDLKSLVSIARATGFSVCALIRLVIPDAPLDESNFAPETVALAQRISELSPDQRLRADQYLMGLFHSQPGHK